MFPVSERFITALAAPHRVTTVVTATPPGGEALTVQVTRLSVTADAGSRMRRRASLECFATAEDWAVLSTDGCLFRVEHGIDFGGGDVELVPVFTGEASQGVRALAPGGGSVSLPLQDLWAWISRTDFLNPVVITAGTSRVQAIIDLVQDARPGTPIATSVTASGGTVGADLVLDGSRADAINTLASDGRLSVYFDGAGSFVIRDAPLSTDASVVTLRQLTAVERSRPLDKMYNTVVVNPSATDGSQTWTQQVAQITDPAHPRHPDKVGVVPYRVASPTAQTAGDALTIALNTLDRVVGSTESLSLGLVANPALDAGDVVRVVTPQVDEEPADIIQHVIDSLSMDLVTGGMSLSTRSLGVV